MRGVAGGGIAALAILAIGAVLLLAIKGSDSATSTITTTLPMETLELSTEEETTLQVKVLEEISERPLENAKVVILSEDGALNEGNTGTEGTVTFKLPKGSVVISVSHSGYKGERREVLLQQPSIAIFELNRLR